MRNVDKAPRQITGVCRLQRGIGKTFPSAVRGNEVFQNRKPFTEAGLDGDFDRFAVRVGHQTAHARQLFDLVDGATRAGVRHHPDGVEFFKRVFQFFRYVVRRFFPYGNDLFISFVVGNTASFEELFDVEDLFFRIAQNGFLVGRHLHIENAGRQRADGGIFIAERLDIVQNFRAGLTAVRLKARVNDFGKLFLAHGTALAEGILVTDLVLQIVLVGFSLLEPDVLRNLFVENDLADGDLGSARNGCRTLFGLYALDVFGEFHRSSDVNFILQLDVARLIRHDRLFFRRIHGRDVQFAVFALPAERIVFFPFFALDDGQVIRT